MALRKFVRSFWNILRYKGSLSEKISASATVFRLHIKRLLSDHKNTRVRERYRNTTFYGLEYGAMEHLFNEIFLAGEYNFNTSHPNPVIIDCGANIGMSVLFFKRKYPGAKIMAFEANPHAYALLEENIRVNNLKDIELHNIALHDYDGTIPFYIGEHKASLMGSVMKRGSGDSELVIPARRLSGYLKGLEKADLIKIDVEGAETHIIDDLTCHDLLGISQQYIIEYHHNMHDTPSRLAGFLHAFEQHGFSYNLRTSFDSIHEFQDILIHFYQDE